VSPLHEHAPMLRSAMRNLPRGRDMVRSGVMTDTTNLRYQPLWRINIGEDP
jgi:hypothetical protein